MLTTAGTNGLHLSGYILADVKPLLNPRESAAGNLQKQAALHLTCKQPSFFKTGSLLAATRRTTTTWPPTSPQQRHNQEKPKERGYGYQLVEISGATARCMDRHRNVVLEMKAVFVACDRQL